MTPLTLQACLIPDTDDVAKPGQYQLLDKRWNVTRGRLSAWRIEIGCPCCGHATEFELSPAGDRRGVQGHLRWDGNVQLPTVFGRIVIAGHGPCGGWSGHLEGGVFRTDAALVAREAGDV